MILFINYIYHRTNSFQSFTFCMGISEYCRLRRYIVVDHDICRVHSSISYYAQIAYKTDHIIIKREGIKMAGEKHRRRRRRNTKSKKSAWIMIAKENKIRQGWRNISLKNKKRRRKTNWNGSPNNSGLKEQFEEDDMMTMTEQQVVFCISFSSHFSFLRLDHRDHQHCDHDHHHHLYISSLLAYNIRC